MNAIEQEASPESAAQKALALNQVPFVPDIVSAAHRVLRLSECHSFQEPFLPHGWYHCNELRPAL